MLVIFAIYFANMYCIVDIICYVKYSLFSVSGPICGAIVSQVGIFLIDSYM